MHMQNVTPAPDRERAGIAPSRRSALALMLGAAGCVGRAIAGPSGSAPVRLAISETLVTDVNVADARAAMVIWIKRMMVDLNVAVELSPNVFEKTEEIVRRVRAGQLDSVALNIVEYRLVADQLDSSEILVGAGTAGAEQYVLVAKRNSDLRQLSNLRGSRLCVLNAPKMCAAPAWLSTILDEDHLGPSDRFFGSLTSDLKASRVVLPVFFGQADACLTSKRSFDTMCELNPQVAKDLAVIATSSPMVVTFYVFHKNYRSPNKEKFIRVLSDVRTSAAGRQLATLFQFDQLAVQNANCLASALSVLERADRVHGKPASGGRKGW